MTGPRLLPCALAVLLQLFFTSAVCQTFSAERRRDRILGLDNSPATLDLGTVQIGKATGRALHVQNTGNVSVTVQSADMDAAEFQLLCPRLPAVLEPGSMLLCNVRFTSQLAREYWGTVNLRYRWRTNEWHESTKAVRVVAAAEGPPSKISPRMSSIGFGAVQISEQKSFMEVLENSGQSPITISRIVALGPGFSFRGINPPLTLYPRQSVSFPVTYSPTSSGLSRGNLWIESNASNSRVSVALEGSALMPGRLKLSSPAMNFGNVLVGSSKKQVATLFARGGPVTVSSATVNNAEFRIAGISKPMTIPAGGMASIMITFTPQVSGKSTAVATFLTEPDNSRVSLPIAGISSAARPHSITLSWDPSGSDTIGYNVYRGTRSGGPYSRINSALTITTDTDDNVSAGQTYYYVVTAVNSDSQESAYSNEASAVVPSP